MIDAEIRDLWTPAGLILFFQVTLFKWRLERETEVGDKNDIPWLVPSDYMSIVGMMCLVFGVILLPTFEMVGQNTARAAFGIGALLFVGQALGLAGHYQLYNKTKRRQFIWWPTQEKVVVGITLLLTACFLFLHVQRYGFY